MTPRLSMKSLLMKGGARISVLSMVLGISIVALPTPFVEAPSAIANEGGGVTDMYTVSESTIEDVPAPAVQPNSSTCDKGLPEMPVVVCGYASFGASVAAYQMGGQRLTTGLPETYFNGRHHGYAGHGQDEYRDVYDPTLDPAIGANHRASNGANSQYYSIGIWWRDKRRWMPKTTIDTATVSNNPKYTFELQSRELEVPIATAPFSRTITEYYTVRKVRPAIKVRTLKIVDNTMSGRDTEKYTMLPAGSAPITTQYITIDVRWTNRDVDWGGPNFPRTPRIQTNECAAHIGPGYMTGPSGNDATNPWPVPTGVGTYDPQTEPKRWNTRPANAESNPYWVEDNKGGKLYSDIGLLYRDWRFKSLNSRPYPHTVGPVSTSLLNAATQAVDNCPDIVYEVSAQDQDCVYLGDTFGSDKGKTFSNTSDYCSKFTPGNYLKEAEGFTTTCQVAEVFWDPEPYDNFGMVGDKRFSNPYGGPVYEKTFLGCDQEVSLNKPATVREWVHWLCDDLNGNFDKNNDYNFADCSGPTPNGPPDVADTYRCVADNGGEPEIIDVESGNITGPESQMLANGKQVQVRWPSPEGIAVLSNGVLSRIQNPDNPWMNWDVVSGSEPVNDDLPLDSSDQKVFGNWRENVDPNSASSDLGGPGKDEWDTPWLYLRAYQAAPVNNTGSSVSVGDANVAPEETLPLGVTTTFDATVKRTVETGLGGTLEINVPVICDMPDAYLYVVSGRALD